MKMILVEILFFQATICATFNNVITKAYPALLLGTCDGGGGGVE